MSRFARAFDADQLDGEAAATVVKDAAAILHSARGTGLTRTDGVRFLRACFGIERLDRRAKRFARAVFLKAARMAACASVYHRLSEPTSLACKIAVSSEFRPARLSCAPAGCRGEELPQKNGH